MESQKNGSILIWHATQGYTMIQKVYKSYMKRFGSTKRRPVVGISLEPSGAVKFDLERYFDTEAGKKELQRISEAWEQKRPAIGG